jgi:hypothetical protein
MTNIGDDRTFCRLLISVLDDGEYGLTGAAEPGAAVTERNVALAKEISDALRRAGYTQGWLHLDPHENNEQHEQTEAQRANQDNDADDFWQSLEFFAYEIDGAGLQSSREKIQYLLEHTHCPDPRSPSLEDFRQYAVLHLLQSIVGNMPAPHLLTALEAG